jgi:hypothetical protein
MAIFYPRQVQLQRHRWLAGKATDLVQDHQGEDAFTFGIDAEIVPLLGDQTIYPHAVGLGQDRPEGLGHPWVVNDCGDWHGDGFAFEVCTMPGKCLDGLMGRMSSLFKKLRNNLEGEMTRPESKLYLNAPTLYEVPLSVVESAPPRARLLGCAPSFNVYPDDEAKPGLLGHSTRTTGCHLHLSHPKFDNESCKQLIRWADVLVGNTWTMLSPEAPADEAFRRAAYGRAGEHRRNIYPASMEGETVIPEMRGAEYRVLPGRVLTNPMYLTLMMNLYREAGRFVLDGLELDAGWSEMARAAINTADAGVAEKLFGVLPFADEARKIIYFYKENKMPTMFSSGWEYLGMYGVGFYNYQTNQEYYTAKTPPYVWQKRG